MPDLATLQGQLSDLKAARASGASRVAYEGKATDFRSDAELQAAIASLEHEIEQAQGVSKPRVVITRASKGW